MAVAVHADMLYTVVRFATGKLVVVATARLEVLNQLGVLGEEWTNLGEISGTAFIFVYCSI